MQKKVDIKREIIRENLRTRTDCLAILRQKSIQNV